MKIGLLVCDHIQNDFLGYPELFGSLLPDYRYEIFNVCDGVLPNTAMDCDGWIITGSKYSVYDDIDWIVELKYFVKEIANTDKYCIGVCFGHQMLGEAMGGVVKKSPMGWCVGVHEFEIVQKESWMTPFQPQLSLLMSCQDQIQNLPPNSVVLAKSKLCPVGIVRIGERMLGIQGHPEFSVDYVKSLIEDRTNRIGKEIVRTGIESLVKPTHSSEMARWIENFLSNGRE
jgi:GMP synthase-like glutamine amidotransferase